LPRECKRDTFVTIRIHRVSIRTELDAYDLLRDERELLRDHRVLPCVRENRECACDAKRWAEMFFSWVSNSDNLAKPTRVILRVFLSQH